MKSNRKTKDQSNHRQPFVAGFILPVLLFAALAPTVFFQSDYDTYGDPSTIKQTPAPETPEEKEARMLRAFDRENRIPGRLIVSFENDVTAINANAILETFGLSLNITTNCYEANTVSPGGQANPDGEPNYCVTGGWDDDLKYGIVLVPNGTEKDYARQLYAHEKIVWVEPDYETTLAGDGSSTIGTIQNPGTGEDNQTFVPPTNTPGGSGPTYSNESTNTFMGIDLIWVVLGIVVIGIIGYFAMGKK